MSDEPDVRAGNLVTQLRKQNWKLGGHLALDTDEAVALVLDCMGEVRREALSAAMGKADWQPIETVPRDNTVLVVIEPTESNKTFFGKLKPQTHPAYINEGGQVCDCGGWEPDVGIVSGNYRATHWMPLPEPPKAAP